MGANSSIQWTDNTFNPWMGCTEVGPGCDGCYARVLMQDRWGKVKWGVGEKRVRTSPANWRQPLQWNKQAEASRAPQKVFCCSLADVFDNEVPQEWRDDLWALIDRTPWLRWQILTKRISNVGDDMIPLRWKREWPRHVGIMVTVVTQKEVDRDVPRLLGVKALFNVRWVGLSCEPLLERITIAKYLRQGQFCPYLDWAIVGGESGNSARPFNVNWAESLMAEGAAAGMPIFVKQLGAKPMNGILRESYHLRDDHGGDWSEWPEHLRVRQFPEALLS